MRMTQPIIRLPSVLVDIRIQLFTIPINIERFGSFGNLIECLCWIGSLLSSDCPLCYGNMLRFFLHVPSLAYQSLPIKIINCYLFDVCMQHAYYYNDSNNIIYYIKTSQVAASVLIVFPRNDVSIAQKCSQA